MEFAHESNERRVAKLQALLDEIKNAEDQVKALKEKRYGVLTDVLQDAKTESEDVLREIAWYVYYLLYKQYPMTPISLIFDVGAQKLPKILPEAYIPLTCQECGKPYAHQIKNRFTLQNLNSRKSMSWWRKICPECRETLEREAKEKSVAEKKQKAETRKWLSTMPYNEYLKTKHWKWIRGEKLKHAGYRCQMCNRKDVSLHVHHRTYERRGYEDFSDLIVLCADCHAKFHEVES